MLYLLQEVVNQNFKRKVLEGVEIEHVKLLDQLSHDQQGDFLNKLQEKIIPPGGRCITQGNENDTFFVIKTGVARVLLDRGI